jgi:hypothetical protein
MSETERGLERREMVSLTLTNWKPKNLKMKMQHASSTMHLRFSVPVPVPRPVPVLLSTDPYSSRLAGLVDSDQTRSVSPRRNYCCAMSVW